MTIEEEAKKEPLRVVIKDEQFDFAHLSNRDGRPTYVTPCKKEFRRAELIEFCFFNRSWFSRIAKMQKGGYERLQVEE